LVALAAGGAWWLWPGEAAAGKPSVAVLPLANLSGDPRWERCAADHGRGGAARRGRG
jgi:TolB-like protein